MIDVLETEQQFEALAEKIQQDGIETIMQKLNTSEEMAIKLIATAKSLWELQKFNIWKEWADGFNDN